jgi:hypothetical protein
VDACTTRQHTAANTSSSTNNTSKCQAVRVQLLAVQQRPCLLAGQLHKHTVSKQLQPTMQGLVGRRVRLQG